MPLQAPSTGARRERVRFQRRATEANVGGVNKGDWADLFGGAVFAVSLLPTTGGEDIVGGRLQGRAAFDLWALWCADLASLSTGDRAVDDRDPTRLFNIRFCQDPDSRRRRLFMQLELATK